MALPASMATAVKIVIINFMSEGSCEIYRAWSYLNVSWAFEREISLAYPKAGGGFGSERRVG